MGPSLSLKTRLKSALWYFRHDGVRAVGRRLVRTAGRTGQRLLWRGARLLPRRFRLGTRRLRPDDEYFSVSSRLFQISQGDLALSRQAQVGVSAPLRSATWFVPYFEHVSYGGIHTIFRLMESFADKGVENTVVIFDNAGASEGRLRSTVSEAFPDLEFTAVLWNKGHENASALAPTDIGIATQWASAYALLRFNECKQKYYLLQDYEPLFYQAGSFSALAESTYRFGFLGIVSTEALLAELRGRHGMGGYAFTPAVDARYSPPERPRDNNRPRVFFYTRPGSPRNAFSLVVTVMQRLWELYGDSIEMVAAGEAWREGDYGLAQRVSNLGRLPSLDQVADLYRTCDIGVVYMLTRHPSYQPFEFMASGMATVSNYNESNLWLLDDGVNCLLSEPSPLAMTEKISLLLEDAPLRRRIAANGVDSIRSDWQEQADGVYGYINNNQGAMRWAER